MSNVRPKIMTILNSEAMGQDEVEGETKQKNQRKEGNDKATGCEQRRQNKREGAFQLLQKRRK